MQKLLTMIGAAAVGVLCAAMPQTLMAGTAVWNGSAGDGSMANGDNWEGGSAPAAGDALNFSSITAATTLNADFGDDRTFGAVTMGTAVITFTGSLAAASFNDYSKVAVGANSTVTVNGNISISGSSPKFCNAVGAGGKLRVTGKLTIAHSYGDFYFAQNNSDGAIVVEGGIVVNTANWVLVKVKSLVLGANGISFSKDSVIHFTNNCIVYSLGASTVLGTQGVGSYCASNPLTICTTQFESDQPATITFAGNLTGKKSYWSAPTITGCGKVVFASTSTSNRGLTVKDGATLVMTPGANTSNAGDQTFALNAGATLEVATAGTANIGGKATFADGSSLNIAAYSAGSAALSVAGTLTLPSSGTVNLTLNGGAFTPGVYVILQNSGVTAAMGDKFSVSTGGETASWSVVNNRLVLTVGDVNALPPFRWTGAVGDGKMSSGGNWTGGAAPDADEVADFSGITVATTINADLGVKLSTVTMGTAVITFTNALTSTAFSNYSKVAVGANSTVTIDGNLSFTGASPSLCNSVGPGGKLRVTGTLYDAHSFGDFCFTESNSAGAVVVEGGITINSANWVVLSVKSLVLGSNGINFTKTGRLCIWNSPTVYSLGANTVIDTGTTPLSTKSDQTLTFCTTQFESDQPATITFSGYIHGQRLNSVNYYGGTAVTGCGRIDFTADSKTDRTLDVSGGATIAIAPGCNSNTADQTFTINADSTLEVAGSGTATLGFKTTTVQSGATLAFNFTEKTSAPALSVVSGRTVSLPAAVEVKIGADDGVRPRSGDYVLTSGIDCSGKTVNLVDKPNWVQSVDVDGGGNIVLTVKPVGFVIIVQ